LLEKADLVWQGETLALFQITPDVLFESSAKKEFVSFREIKDGLFYRNGFLVTDSASPIIHKGFDDLPSYHILSGKGAFHGNKRDLNMIAEFSPGTFEQGKEYIASTWMYNDSIDALNFWFRLIFEEYDPLANTWEISYIVNEQSEIINGSWSLVELQFKVNNSNNPTYLKTKGKLIDKAEFTLDDLLIREKGVNVFLPEYNEDGSIKQLFKNNHRIRILEEY